MVRNPILQLAVLVGVCLAATEMEVHDLSPNTLQAFATRRRRAMVLMYEKSCAATQGFQPWLFALAQMFPSMAVGQLDVTDEGGEAITSVFNVTKLPQIKVFARDNPKGQRVVNYEGELEFDSLYNWTQAVQTGQDHELSSFGPEPAESPMAPSNSNSGSTGNAFANLPPEVRKMATTMVRESRLQKLLKQQGGGRLERYDRMVSQRYRQIMKEEGTDLSDKFGVQEANRRARDQVREEILESAPEHIREEVESDVSMGDLAGQSAR